MTTVLILEDDASICQLLSRVCAAQGYAVVTAADGLAGAKQIITAHPDLVISDINLPLRSGPEVIGGVLPAQIPVVFISGNGQSSVTVNGRAYPVVAKPFDVFELINQINALLAPTPRAVAG